MKKSQGNTSISTRSKDSPEHKKLPVPLARTSLPKDEEGNLIYKRRSATSNSAEAGLSATVASVRKAALENEESPPVEAEVTLPPTLPKKKRTVIRTDDSIRECDAYCWICHMEAEAGSHVTCSLCPRLYHKKCAPSFSAAGRACPECQKVMAADCVDTQSKAMRQMNSEHFCSLLRQAVSRMKCTGSEPFLKPVDLVAVPSYLDYIVQPMDLSTLEKNIRKKLYGSTEAFLADCKWILHNCIVFNGYQHELTGVAKAIMKTAQHEMSELEICPDCYTSSCMQGNTEWFCEPCREPHPLVWAKMRSFPYWPAKALRVVKGEVDCRFFGAHDRAWVPLNQVFMLSKEPPIPLKQKKAGYQQSLDESKMHIQKLKEKFGSFEYAPTATPFDSSNASPSRPRKDSNNSSDHSQNNTPSRVLAKEVQSASPSTTTDSEKQQPSPARTASFGVLKMKVRHPNEWHSSPVATAMAQSIRSRHQKAISNKRSQSTKSDGDEGIDCRSAVSGGDKAQTDDSGTDNGGDSGSSATRDCSKVVSETVTVRQASQTNDKPLSSKDNLFAKLDAILGQTKNGDSHVSENDYNEGTSCRQLDGECNDDASATSSDSTMSDGPRSEKTMSSVAQIVSADVTAVESVVAKQAENKSSSVDLTADSVDKQQCQVVQTTQKEQGDKGVPTATLKKSNRLLDNLVATCMAKLGLPSEGNAELDNHSEPSDDDEDVDEERRGDNSDENDRCTDASTAPGVAAALDDKAPEDISASTENVSQHQEKVTGDDNNLDNKPSCHDDNGKCDLAMPSSIPTSIASANAVDSAVTMPITTECTRVSTDDESKGTSVSEQRDALTCSDVPNSLTQQSPDSPPQPPSLGSPSIAMSAASSPKVLMLNSQLDESSQPMEGVRSPTPSMGDHDSSNDSCALVIDLDNGAQSSSRRQQRILSNSSGQQNVVDAERLSLGGKRKATSQSAQQPTKRRSVNSSSKVEVSDDAVITGEQQQQPSLSSPRPHHKAIDNSLPADVHTLLERSQDVVANSSVTFSGIDFGLRKYLSQVETSVNQVLTDLFKDFIVKGAAQSIQSQMQKELDKIKQMHKAEVKELKHNADLRIAEMRTSLQREKDEAVAEVKRQCEQDKSQAIQQAIQQTKKKPWCANCWKEAQFYCCWNTSYCGYDCQQAHWPDHMTTCTQTAATASSSSLTSSSATVTPAPAPSGGSAQSQSVGGGSGIRVATDHPSSIVSPAVGRKVDEWRQEKGGGGGLVSRAQLASPPIRSGTGSPAANYRTINASGGGGSGYMSVLAPGPQQQQSFQLSNGAPIQVQYLPTAPNTMMQQSPGFNPSYPVPIGQLQVHPNNSRGGIGSVMPPQQSSHQFHHYAPLAPRQQLQHHQPVVTQVGYPTTANQFPTRQF